MKKIFTILVLLTSFFGKTDLIADAAQDKINAEKQDDQRFENAREERTRVDTQLQEQRDQENQLERQREDDARIQRKLDDQRWNSAHGR
jgi:septal ring factor EnvC (AmiA/AmiB activator)